MMKCNYNFDIFTTCKMKYVHRIVTFEWIYIKCVELGSNIYNYKL